MKWTRRLKFTFLNKVSFQQGYFAQLGLQRFIANATELICANATELARMG